MLDLRIVRDLGLAVLLAGPTVALARPQPAPTTTAPAVTQLVEKAALADRTSAERRFALPG